MLSIREAQLKAIGITFVCVRQRYLCPGFLLRRRQTKVERQILSGIWSGSLDGLETITIRMRKIRSRLEADAFLTSVCFFASGLMLSNAVSSHGPPKTFDQPSKTRSTPRFLPAPSRTINSATNSDELPLPSPLGPKTNASVSYRRSLTGRKTPQNLGQGETGGGGIRNSVAICAISAGG
jgi:hypothetical protein